MPCAVTKPGKGIPMYKKAQVAVVEKVVARVCKDLRQQAADIELEDPLLWCAHGGPGTGKAEFLKLLKELFDKFGGGKWAWSSRWLHYRP